MADPSTCSAPAPAAPDLPTRNSPHTSPSPEHTTLLPTPPSPPAGSGGKSKTQVYNCDATDTPVYNTRDKGGALSCADCKQAPEKAHKVARSLLARPLPLPSTESLPTPCQVAFARVREMVASGETERKHPPEDPTEELESVDVHPLRAHPERFVINLWKVRQHMVEKEQRNQLALDGLAYVFVLLFMLNYLLTAFPWSANSIKHELALDDLLLVRSATGSCC